MEENELAEVVEGVYMDPSYDLDDLNQIEPPSRSWLRKAWQLEEGS